MLCRNLSNAFGSFIVYQFLFFIENQNAKVSDSQSHDQQSQPPSGQNTLRRHNKRTFVNQSRDNRHKDHKYEDGPHMPANVRKKQSMDSKLDETVRDGQQKVIFSKVLCN